MSIAKVLKINLSIVVNTANQFNGLDYRQQIIHNSENLTIINDSKSTSFSSTIPLLESFKNIYWILGLAKKGDKFKLKKNIFKYKSLCLWEEVLISSLSNKIFCKSSSTLKLVLKSLSKNIEKDKNKKVILFSP